MLSGGAYLTPEWAAALDDDHDRGVPDLAPREAEALRLYATGLPLKSVARRMGIQPETAKEYLVRVKRKYADARRPAPTKTDLYRRAVEDGHLHDDGPAGRRDSRIVAFGVRTSDPVAPDPAVQLEVTLNRVGAAVAAVAWVVAVLTGVHDPQYYRPAVFAVGMSALGVGVVWALLDGRARTPRRRGLQLYVAVTVVLSGVQTLIVVSDQPPLYPPMVHALAAGACLSPLAFGGRAGLVVAVWWGLAFAAVRAPEVGFWRALLEGAWSVSSSASVPRRCTWSASRRTR